MSKTVEERMASLELRVKLLESFLGHQHPDAPSDDAGFQEYPKQVGDKVVYSAEEEKALGAAPASGTATGVSAAAGPKPPSAPQGS